MSDEETHTDEAAAEEVTADAERALASEPEDRGEQVPEPLAELDERAVPESLMLELWHETGALAPERLRRGFRTLGKRQPVLVEFVGNQASGLSETGQSQAMFLLYLVYKTFVRFHGRAFQRFTRGKIEQAAARLQHGLSELDERRRQEAEDDAELEQIDWIAERQPVVFSFVLHLLGDEDSAGEQGDREEADRIAMILMHVLEVLDGEMRAV